MHHRLSRLALLLLLSLVVVAPLAPITRPAEADIRTMPPLPAPQTRELVAQHGKGYVELINGQMVIHLEGSYYDMGYQHGRMLPERCRQCIDAYVRDMAMGKAHMTMDQLTAIWKAGEPFLPTALKDELRGLAEGAGIPLEMVQAAHALPEKFHCSGAAAWGNQTIDGKLYHFRSLDYSISIGNEVKIQQNAALIVRKPTGKVASAIVGWTGTCGCVTGMNNAGISIGEMGCGVNDETFAGFPMFFLLRYILDEADTLDEALDILKRAPRTAGFNFIFGDGKGPHPRAVALEVDRQRVAVFEGGDKKEDVAPHFGIPQCVRRVNHFVDPELAGRQRRVYDPRESEQSSWLGYKMISDYLQSRSGKIDHSDMIQIGRNYPPTHSCLHQAVMCPSDGRIWVANAVDPADTAFAGAQNQTFHPYNLRKLLATDPATLPRGEMPPAVKPRAVNPAAADATSGKVISTALGGDKPADAAMRAEWQRYVDISNSAVGSEFAWKLEQVSRTSSLDISELTFPSAVANGPEINHTVHAKLFMPRAKADGKRPAMVLLHHLQDDQTLEQMIANFYASAGHVVVMMYLPHYGPRATGTREKDLLAADPKATFLNIAQAVWDLHRLRDWLRARPDVDGNRLSVFGVSLGGIMSAVSAGVDPGFSHYVLGLAGGELKTIIMNPSNETRAIRDEVIRRGLTPEQMDDLCRPIDPLTFASRVEGKFLMINVSQDDVIPKACTEKLWKALGEPTIQWYEGDHNGMALHLFDALQRVKKFLAE
ncbi:MAG: C45 family autoproteolytic acyltransferase/hydrolase [Planctomycetota bacterium]